MRPQIRELQVVAKVAAAVARAARKLAAEEYAGVVAVVEVVNGLEGRPYRFL